MKTGSDSMIVTGYEVSGNFKIVKGIKFNSNGSVYKCPYRYPVYEP